MGLSCLKNEMKINLIPVELAMPIDMIYLEYARAQRNIDLIIFSVRSRKPFPLKSSLFSLDLFSTPYNLYCKQEPQIFKQNL